MTRSAGARSLTGAFLTLAAAAFGAGLLGVAAPVPATVLGTLLCHAAYLVRLLRLGGWARRDGQRRLLRPIAGWTVGVALVAAGFLVAGLGERFAAGARVAQVPLPAECALIALFLCVGGYLVGLARPEVAPAPMARVRQLLDGTGIGIFCFFILWVLLFEPVGPRGAGLSAGLLASIAVAAALVFGFREGGRAGTAVAASGVALSIGGLAGFTLALDYFAPRAWFVLAGVVASAGAGVLCAGGYRLAGPSAGTGPARAPYPLLSLPLVAAGVVAGYHLLQQHTFDRLAIELGLAGMATVALREWAAATDARRYAARLADQDAHLRSLVAGSSDVTMVLDRAFLVRWQSAAAARQLGLSDQDVLGRPVVTLLHPEDVDQVANCLTELGERVPAGRAIPAQVGVLDARMRDGFGSWRDTEWSVTRNELGAAAWSLVVHIRDVSRHKELERAVRRTAATDRLTGLANREGLRAGARMHSRYRALILIRVGVASVNNAKGHDVGDAALVEAGRRLRATVSLGDLPARLSAATFAVLTEVGAVQAHLLATRLLTVLTEPYPVPGTVVHLSASAGLTDLGPDADLDEALRQAELALHSTWGRRGTRAVEWYDESSQAQLRRRLAIEQELPGALVRGELDLAYQPVVELAGGYPVGAEALLRWRHPTLGPVPPAEFIPVAEELGLLDEITQWVLHWACRQLSLWARDGREVWLSVNVRAATLARPAFVPAVRASLQTHLVPAAQLVLEVAEPGIEAETELSAVVDHLSELRALGTRIAVDHFGTGATSLSQLRVLPLDIIKIDRQIFGEPAARTGSATAIVDVVVKLGRHIGLEIIAQGLESDADLETAREAGCRFGQGYAVSRPAPPEHVEAFLDAHRAPRM